MGGPAVVDGVRTLVLVGNLQQRSPLGDYTAAVTTTILYPASVRRDVTLPTLGTISSVLTPEEAFMTGALGTFELGPAERDRLEANTMRFPLSLLKSRHQPLFRASAGAASPPGKAGDVLEIRLASAETTLLLDAEGRIVEVAFTGTALVDLSKKEKIRIVYSDFRNVSGLMFPFSSEGWMGEEKLSTGQLDEVRVNGEVAAELFRMPSPAATPTPTPAPRSGGLDSRRQGERMTARPPPGESVRGLFRALSSVSFTPRVALGIPRNIGKKDRRRKER